MMDQENDTSDCDGPSIVPNGSSKQMKTFEWKAMSEWLKENKGTNKIPEDDGWEIYHGTLRRELAEIKIQEMFEEQE